MPGIVMGLERCGVFLGMSASENSYPGACIRSGYDESTPDWCAVFARSPVPKERANTARGMGVPLAV